MTRFAEVIGDPVSHSLSPAIHNHWLQELGIDARFEATRVAADRLADYLSRRRTDRVWAGCSITAPLKEVVLPLLDDIDDRRTGAVNCVYRAGDALHGTNTDLDGLAAALDGVPIEGERVAVIGAGGAARALLAYLAGRRVAETVLLVREPARAASLLAERVRAAALDGSELEPVRLIVNATPLGLAGGTAMPPALLADLPSRGAAVMDMVYSPLETPLLAAAHARGLEAIDGLAMLIGQARRAFRLFFGAEPPAGDAALRALLSRAG